MTSEAYDKWPVNMLNSEYVILNAQLVKNFRAVEARNAGKYYEQGDILTLRECRAVLGRMQAIQQILVERLSALPHLDRPTQ